LTINKSVRASHALFVVRSEVTNMWHIIWTHGLLNDVQGRYYYITGHTRRFPTIGWRWRSHPPSGGID
jgi:hypothetical protein